MTNNEKSYIELIENSEDILTVEQIMKVLHVSRATVFRLRQKLKDQIVKRAKDLCRGKAIKMVRCLDKNASNGDTGAAVKILEIGGVYVPKQIGGGPGTVNLGIIVLPTREVLPGKPVEVEVRDGKQNDETP